MAVCLSGASVGDLLAGKSFAMTMDLGPAGRSRIPIVMDGPFVETKEAIGSYAIVEVTESWPGGGFVKIRPVMEG